MPSPILWVMPHYSIERSPAPSLAVVEGMPTAKDAHQLPGTQTVDLRRETSKFIRPQTAASNLPTAILPQ